MSCTTKTPVVKKEGFVVSYKETYNINIDKCYDFDFATDLIIDKKWSSNEYIEMKIIHFHYCTTGQDDAYDWHVAIKKSMTEKKSCTVVYSDLRADWIKTLVRKNEFNPTNIILNP